MNLQIISLPAERLSVFEGRSHSNCLTGVRSSEEVQGTRTPFALFLFIGSDVRGTADVVTLILVHRRVAASHNPPPLHL